MQQYLLRRGRPGTVAAYLCGSWPWHRCLCGSLVCELLRTSGLDCCRNAGAIEYGQLVDANHEHVEMGRSPSVLFRHVRLTMVFSQPQDPHLFQGSFNVCGNALCDVIAYSSRGSVRSHEGC